MQIRLLALLSVACAATTTTAPPPGGPRGLRASEHLEVARQHDAQAHESNRWAGDAIAGSAGQGSHDQPVPLPWYRSWNAGAEHERMAAIHRSEAAQLEAAYDEACRGLTGARAAISPLKRYATGGWPTTNGVILYLSSTAGDPDALLAQIRCHRAFMMLAPANMDDCPLDLPDLALDARGAADGITVSLSVRDAKLVPELQRRTMHELETSPREDVEAGEPH